MRSVPIIILVLLAVGSAEASARQILIREEAPTDRAVGFSLSELEESYLEMDAAGISTIRLLEGGTHNVNIRRIRVAKRP